MQAFYDRYQAGEHQQVWSELIALGDAVRKPPIYADAVAVARETMRRAQSNLETLLGRLHSIGYRFETEQSAVDQSLERMASLTRQMEALRANTNARVAEKMKGLFELVTNVSRRAGIECKKRFAARPAANHPLEDPSIYRRASKRSARQIANAESRLRGPLPLSLAAWYEAVENVSFLGSHPKLNPSEPSQAPPRMSVSPSMLQGPGGPQRRQLAESLGFRVTDKACTSSVDENALPHPLVIVPLEDVLGEDGESEGGSFMISPDDLQKAHISGDEYYIDLPDRNADVLFQDWKGDYFVEYLRRAFRWGGFPGWERHRNPPIHLIQE